MDSLTYIQRPPYTKGQQNYLAYRHKHPIQTAASFKKNERFLLHICILFEFGGTYLILHRYFLQTPVTFKTKGLSPVLLISASSQLLQPLWMALKLVAAIRETTNQPTPSCEHNRQEPSRKRIKKEETFLLDL